MKSAPELILASTSPYRAALLERLGLRFRTLAPGVEETRLDGESARALAIRLARAKAEAVALQFPDAWAIGSDQVAALDHAARGELALGKPGSVAKCQEQLRECSGRTLDFLTAVAVARHASGALHEFIDVTRVTYRQLDESTIERYVASEHPVDCAGAFKSEGLGIALCAAIDTTDPTALIGLPLIGLSDVLRRVGYWVP